MTAMLTSTWYPLCSVDALEPERGVAALLPDGTQIAIFRTHDDTVFALANQDPFTGAMVLSRGIVGDKAGRPVVCSPMYKQAFDLRTGECLDDPARNVTQYPVRVVDGVLEVELS
ncbi:nitrite reductase (NAD(P)H) small subunit [Pseudonocardiaceae bacterium YIM PH 21723]|nr:nitrite reductase (NAD(P)H) small subunit [Pseudonocardiaceae bacterium YIM PH 21723]